MARTHQFSQAYGAYLVFQLWSHAALYEDDSADNFRSTPYDKVSQKSTHSEQGRTTGVLNGTTTSSQLEKLRKDAINPPTDRTSDEHRDLEQQAEEPKEEEAEDEEGGEEPTMSLWMAVGALALVTVVSIGFWGIVLKNDVS